MKSLNTLHRTFRYGALTGALGLLVACGMDPPPANTTPAATATPPAIQGLKPSLDSSAQVVTENSTTTKCNIETIGGSSLEGVRPIVDVNKTVGVAGWYTNSAATGAVVADNASVGGSVDSTASSEPVGDGVTGPGGTSAPTELASGTGTPARTGDPGLQLVIVSEDGSKHWMAAVPSITERPDVAAAMNDPGLLNSGFAFDLDLSELQPGFYSLHLSDKARAATSVCGLGRGFAVE